MKDKVTYLLNYVEHSGWILELFGNKERIRCFYCGEDINIPFFFCEEKYKFICLKCEKKIPFGCQEKYKEHIHTNVIELRNK